MKEETRVGCLKDEYLFLQGVYEDYDRRVLLIKGWSTTVGMAAIATGFYQSKYLWLFAVGTGIIFWWLEALWKGFQYMYAPRIEALEQAFASGDFSPESIQPLQVYSKWFEVFQEEGFQVWRNMKLPLVAVPHVLVIAAGLGLFIVQQAGWIDLLPHK